MSGTVRKFTDADYPALVALANAVNPSHPTTEKDMRYWELHREDRIVWGRLVYEKGGEIIGVAYYSLMAWMFHPRKYAGSVAVLPEHRKRGIGSALYDRLLAELNERDALLVMGDIRDDREESRRFAEKRGFVSGLWEQESGLDLVKFAPEAFADVIERAESSGIRLVGYEDLADDPERHCYSVSSAGKNAR